MIKDIVAATFNFFNSIESTPIEVEQVNDLSVIGTDKYFKFKLTFSEDFSLACFMLFTPDGVNVQVYKLENGKYRFSVHA